MDLALEGKTALVTGGSAGIGKAAAKALAMEGVHVAIAARDPERLEAAAAEIREASRHRVLSISADMREREQIETTVSRVVAEFGRLDILVNNAGASRFGDPLTMDAEIFADAMKLKYLGYVLCAREAAGQMIKQGWGRIINVIGSASKQILEYVDVDGSAGKESVPAHLAGGASNAALVMFTKGFGLRLARHGVLVNAVSPAAVMTERLLRLIRQSADSRGITHAEAEREFFKDYPLRRPARPEEIADLILFLASERASYFVGSNTYMDGGAITAI